MPLSDMRSRVEDRTLILERTFNAPRELVFKVFSEAEHLQRWYAPGGWSVPYCNVDFRPGGVWHYCMRSPDNAMESWGKAVYHEIEPPEKIVYTDYFSDAEGNIAESMPSTTIVMTFTEAGGKTTIESRAEYASTADLQKVMDMGMLQGVTETWDRLEDLLKELQA